MLVNNAGSYHEAGSIIDQTWESWKRAIDVNLVSMFHCCKPAAERMVAQGTGGAIVNISSVDGYLPCLGTGYDSAKAGVVHFTRSLALDLAPHQIRVNGVAPGAVLVPTLVKKRSGELPPVWPGSSVPTGLHGRADATSGRRTSRSAARARPTRSPTLCCSSARRRRRT